MEDGASKSPGEVDAQGNIEPGANDLDLPVTDSSDPQPGFEVASGGLVQLQAVQGGTDALEVGIEAPEGVAPASRGDGNREVG